MIDFRKQSNKILKIKQIYKENDDIGGRGTHLRRSVENWENQFQGVPNYGQVLQPPPLVNLLPPPMNRMPITARLKQSEGHLPTFEMLPLPLSLLHQKNHHHYFAN